MAQYYLDRNDEAHYCKSSNKNRDKQQTTNNNSHHRDSRWNNRIQLIHPRYWSIQPELNPRRPFQPNEDVVDGSVYSVKGARESFEYTPARHTSSDNVPSLGDVLITRPTWDKFNFTFCCVLPLAISDWWMNSPVIYLSTLCCVAVNYAQQNQQNQKLTFEQRHLRSWNRCSGDR
jgi:hypothetical protein